MANAEIGLARLSTSVGNHSGNETNLSDSEKIEVSSIEGTPRNDVHLDSNTPIVKHYLTFETPLPIPSTIYNGPETGDARPSPPAQPDMRKYRSPFLWSKARKNYTVYVSVIATAIAGYAAGSYSEGADQMSAEWGVSKVAIYTGITAFTTGFAVAPMVLAPFSEINGRYPVFILSGILYFICQVSCAVTRSFPGMIVARFFCGCGCSVFSTMVGGVVSDLYHAEGRNTPMALFSGGALFGTGLGPLVSGFIAQNTSWRWIFWVQVFTSGITVAVIGISFRETRGSIILSRRARALNTFYESMESLGYFGVEMEIPVSTTTTRNHEDSDPEKSRDSSPPREHLETSTPRASGAGGTSVSVSGDKTPSNYSLSPSHFQTQRIRWLVKSDEERASLSQMIGISIYRPFHLLTTEPVVFAFSLWVAFAWAVLYLTFGSIPLVFSTSHNFSIQQSGAIFASLSIASVLSTILSIYQEKLIRGLGRKFGWKLEGLETPEGRLYFACVESVLLPIGLFWFGWTQFGHIPWILPALGIGCATMGIYSIYLATFNYLADTYHRYASSALAAQSFCRNVLGGIFPLITTAMFNNLGFANAASLLGAVGAALTVVPWVLVFWGPWIRGRSKFASEIMG